MFIPILLGTARKGRKSEAVAKKLVELVEALGHETELVDVRAAALSATDDTGTSESAKHWKSIVERCKGFIIVTPEYNHGYPGELKLFLDQLYKEYANKVVRIVSVSNGLWGGGNKSDRTATSCPQHVWDHCFGNGHTPSKRWIHDQ